MSTHTDLVEMERSAWRALASSGEDAAAYYERVLADRVLMLLPGGLVIDDRAQAERRARRPGQWSSNAWRNIDVVCRRCSASSV